MITSIILAGLFAVAFVGTAPLRLLSDVSLDSGLGQAVITASGYMAGINDFFPVDVLVNLIVALIAIEGAVLIYRSLMWVIRKIPGIN